MAANPMLNTNTAALADRNAGMRSRCSSTRGRSWCEQRHRNQAIATAAPDGYTFGLITLEINLMHWVGLTDLTFEKYTPLALVNQDPAAIHVKADSPYKTVKELFAHIKANPNKVVASGTGQGGSWHVALAGLMQADGVSPGSIRWVPSTGAATALTDLAAGGVDFVACSMPEAEALSSWRRTTRTTARR